MGLTAALIDRARIVRPVSGAPRIEGRSYLVPTSLDWMPARLVPAEAREAMDGDHGRRRIVQAATLICHEADMRTTDTVEVQSAALGDAMWNVVGPPEVLRSSRVRAVTVPLERLIEPEPSQYVG